MKKVVPLTFIIISLFSFYIFSIAKNKNESEIKLIQAKEKEIIIKDDIAPIITLKDGDINLYTGEKYIEPGFTAIDNVDGDITKQVIIKSNLNTSIPGTYKISYLVKDSSNNMSKEVIRKITVLKNRSVKKYQTTKTNDNNINNYIVKLEKYLNNYNVSVGYINLKNNFTYVYKPDKEYNGASLIKITDAMYIYENELLNKNTKELVKKAISRSDNKSHEELVKIIGKSKLTEYIQNIGGRKVPCNHQFYCNTNIHDQLTYWLHLDYLLNTLDNGDELKSYFINDYGNYLSYTHNYDNLHKYGNSNAYFHDAGLFTTNQNSYIIIVLTKERKGTDKSVLGIIETISKRINELNYLVINSK